jgi:hypothetical protein
MYTDMVVSTIATPEPLIHIHLQAEFVWHIID